MEFELLSETMLQDWGRTRRAGALLCPPAAPVSIPQSDPGPCLGTTIFVPRVTLKMDFYEDIL